MDSKAILGPFLALMLLTLLVWTYMYVRRIHFIRANRISNKDLQNPEGLGRMAPMGVVTPSNNFKNLCELPVIFYALALYLIAADRVDGSYLAAAWIFVGFRALHSLVHCTFNHVPLRFLLYLVASVALWFMVVRAALAFF
ncbi:MAG TPA: MAPEG family protein [Steroidobacteraceae bacterium]|nr:MAPEG family protein [Steroidobacteraceae bacterium]